LVSDEQHLDFKFSKADNPDLRMHKLLEIENEDRLKVLACFVFPMFKDTLDLHFSQDCERMIYKDTIYERGEAFNLENQVFTFKEVSKIPFYTPSR